MVGGGGGGGWWWVVVGVEGKNRNKLGACQFRDVNSISPIKSEELQVELKTTNTKAERLMGK